MRLELEQWAQQYPVAAMSGDSGFTGSAVVRLVSSDLPAAIKFALGSIANSFKVKGSGGQGKWSETPWVALLDESITTSVQEGFYVVYLLSRDGNRLYLSLNQGCTLLKNTIGIGGAREALMRRADTMRAKIKSKNNKFKKTNIELGSSLWRPALYAAGEIGSVRYETKSLPPESELVADLAEALRLYRFLRKEGGWAAEDEVIQEADGDGLSVTLSQAKRYRQHRSIERQSGHAKKVKEALGTRCMGCDLEMEDVYGEIGRGLIHAHHLVPLSNLENETEVRLNPRKDFAVLCPNCHSIIHRLDDVADIGKLRSSLLKGSS